MKDFYMESLLTIRDIEAASTVGTDLLTQKLGRWAEELHDYWDRSLMEHFKVMREKGEDNDEHARATSA